MAASGDLISEADGRFPTHTATFRAGKADAESGLSASAQQPSSAGHRVDYLLGLAIAAS